MLSVKAREATD